MTTEPAFRAGDTGTTTSGWQYSVLRDDLKGRVGSLVVVIRETSGVEYPTQYPADGRHPTQRYLDLMPPKVRA